MKKEFHIISDMLRLRRVLQSIHNIAWVDILNSIFIFSRKKKGIPHRNGSAQEDTHIVCICRKDSKVPFGSV